MESARGAGYCRRIIPASVYGPREALANLSAAGPLLALATLALLIAPAGLWDPGSSGAPGLPRPDVGPNPMELAELASPAGLAAAVAPPPPLDWDPMDFQAVPNSSSPTDLREAGGAYAAMSVDNATASALMFGGQVNLTGLTNQTWVVNQTTANWTLLHPATAPSARTDFALSGTSACGVAVLFGGVVDLSTGASTNDTWLFNFTTRKWTNITGPVGPAPRQGAAIAVDPGDCQAVLFGGADEDYRSGNSTGVVQWNDTWALNLGTHVWRHLVALHPPPSLIDARLLYDNVSGLYLLYGGCSTVCSPNVYSFDPATLVWALLTGGNQGLPEGRGAAVWVYSPLYEVAILVDGYALDDGTVEPLNGTFVYLISENLFEQVPPPEPGPRYGSAAGWLNANGCPGVVLVGGADAPSDPPDMWFLDPAPDIPLACNTWGNDSISTAGGGFNCIAQFSLTISILGLPAERPLDGADVSVDGNCSAALKTTGSNGTATFLLAYNPYDIWANCSGYHENFTEFLPTVPNLTGRITLNLTPLATLVVQSFVQEVNATVDPLGNVTIDGGPYQEYVGTTNATGSLVIPNFQALGSSELLTGSKQNYSTAGLLITIPYSGPVFANLTLLAPGPVDVHVLETGAGTPLPGANVTVATTPNQPSYGFRLTANAEGWANGTLPEGQYTARATLPKYLLVTLPPIFQHPWGKATEVTLNLSASVGYQVDVLVLDSENGHPILNASVTVGVYPPELTSASGWANRSGITPGGSYAVVATATNFSSNRTSVDLSYFAPIWILTLDLTPVPGASCTGAGGPGCSKTPQNGSHGELPLTLWPSGTPPLSLVYGGGALLIVVPAAALWIGRRRSASPVGAAPAGPLEAPPR